MTIQHNENKINEPVAFDKLCDGATFLHHNKLCIKVTEDSYFDIESGGIGGFGVTTLNTLVYPVNIHIDIRSY